jgi:hypothetical protein
VNAITQFIIALSTLIAAVAGLINSFRNSGKIKDISAINVDQSVKLDQLKVATNGLTEHLANASKASGTAEGINQGISEERARAEKTAKDLLDHPNGEKK